MRLKSCDLGKYCRSNPLVFSLVPRSQKWYGYAKYVVMPDSFSNLSQSENSGPLSSVNVLRFLFGIFRKYFRVSEVKRCAFILGSRNAIRYPVLRSTKETIRTRLSLPCSVSPSKSPILPRRSTIFCLSSIRFFLAFSRSVSLALVPCLLLYLPFCDLKYFFRCGARSLMYLYMVLVAIDFFFRLRIPAICSGDLCCMSCPVMNRKRFPRMRLIESMAAIRFIRFCLLTSRTSYPSLPPH